ncbi:MAG: hypothetical protein ACKOZM_05430, partial [Flavobacteriales bacterium]
MIRTLLIICLLLSTVATTAWSQRLALVNASTGFDTTTGRVQATGEAGLSVVIDQPSPAIGCGEPVTLTATVTGATEISWKRNGEFITGATTNTFVANQPGIYSVVAVSLVCQLESSPVEV